MQRALRAGDPGALRLVYDLYGALVFSLAIRIVGDYSRAEEVVQDVMTSLWRKPDRFDPERGTFRTWLLTLTRNRAIDALRGSRKRRAAETPLAPQTRSTAAESDPWHMVSVGLERKAIREALESIPPDQREAIELSYFAGLSQSAIAEHLGLPLGTVKGRQRLGLEKLHSYLTGRGLIS